MKNHILFFMLIAFLSVARAQIVRSCDGRYSVEAADRAEMLIKRDGRRVGVVKIDHDIDSGVFSLDGRIFVVCGMPSKISHRSPQAEFISIYLLKPKLRMIMKRTYGGGVYDVAIGSDQKSIFVSSRFGFDVIDIRDMKIKSYDPISEPKFSRQQCKN